MQPIIVSNLRVESVTGPTCYAGESGFSALTAYVKSDDPAIVNQLRRAADEGTAVTIKCATLEIEGHVGNLQATTDGMKDAIAISVDELRYSDLAANPNPARPHDEKTTYQALANLCDIKRLAPP